MCGIVGYVGELPAAPLLLKGLEKLEYRGYDSAGMALVDDRGLAVYRRRGRLQELATQLQRGASLAQQVGIGHTRWATHGKPSDENAHPHKSYGSRFAVVHNGIIENYQLLKEMLADKGITFTSQTDSEVIAHLLEYHYDGDTMEAIRRTVADIHGAYALGILCADTPGVLYAVRQSSPLVVGLAQTGNLIASDVTALLSHTRQIIRPLDGDVLCLSGADVHIWGQDSNAVTRPVERVDWDVEAAEKGGFAHFMLKEITEQPRALADTLFPCIGEDGTVRLEGITFTQEQLSAIQRMVLVACGSAYHAGMAARYFLESATGLPVEVDVASEFRYRNPLVDAHTLTVVVSQSGETADTLAALREAKKRGSRVLAVVNVVGSSVANESDDVLYTRAGPEIAVATTKGYTTQVAMLYLLGLYMGQQSGRLSVGESAWLCDQLRRLPQTVEQCLANQQEIRRLAASCADLTHAFFIGRHMDYAAAMEGALKLKEISYIHAEAYGAGELKHGTISLVEEGTFVVAVACHKDLIAKTLSNIKEVKARGARVLVVTDREHREDFQEADAVLTVPTLSGPFGAVPVAIPLQLLAYYTALERGCDIDKPRNLAKSVTVE